MPQDWTQPAAPEPARDGDSRHGNLHGKREAIIARFTAWLDELLEAEEPPQGVAAELLAAIDGEPLEDVPEACGEYEIWSSLTALTQEVKLQGRAFRDLGETISPLKETLGQLAGEDAPETGAELREAVAALSEARADLERTAAAAATEMAWNEVMDLLLDLRDRLGRASEGLRETLARLRTDRNRRGPGRWLRGARAHDAELLDAVAAMDQGNALILERLDESLTRVGVDLILAAERPFDSATMRAVDVRTRDDVPEGMVAAVHRNGYTWRGRVYRPAEVCVTRRPEAPNDGRTDS